MSRTFSLKRLMLVITLLCITCGLVINYPQQVREFSFVLSWFLPAVIVWRITMKYSMRPKIFTGACVLGAFVGFTLFEMIYLPIIVSLIDPEKLYQIGGRVALISFGWLIVAFGPLLGVLVLGGAIMADEIRQRHIRLPDKEA